MQCNVGHPVDKTLRVLVGIALLPGGVMADADVAIGERDADGADLLLALGRR